MNEMVACGHNRTTEECRTKTKTIRMEYRWNVALNNQSGNNPVSHPFFSELHSILRGDASVKPWRIMRSIQFQTSLRPASASAMQLQEGSEELFSHDLTTINPDHIHDRSSQETGEHDPLEGTSGGPRGAPAQEVGEGEGQLPSHHHESKRSEMVCRMEEAKHEMESRLDSQRRHMVQKESLLQNEIEELKSQMSRMMSDMHTLIATERQHRQELEQAELEKQELLELVKGLQKDYRSTRDGNDKGATVRPLTRLESMKRKPREVTVI